MTRREEIINNIGYKMTRAALEYVEKHEFADAIDAFEAGAEWAIETIFNWLKDNMDTRKTVMKDMLGKDMCVEYLTADFKSVNELIDSFKYDKLVTEE